MMSDYAKGLCLVGGVRCSCSVLCITNGCTTHLCTWFVDDGAEGGTAA